MEACEGVRRGTSVRFAGVHLAIGIHMREWGVRGMQVYIGAPRPPSAKVSPYG